MENRICTRGVWDSSVPGIDFDENGVSNYARMFDSLIEAYPRGEKGLADWQGLLEKIKSKGQGRKYDCVVGVSGGTDSSYLLYILKNSGLRPLAVNLDNGWNSDISVKNIKKMTSALAIDLETYVINYEEIKDLLRAYMRASLPWVDMPTDMAIKAVLYRVARREKIKYILRGNDFRSEGFQPREWTYGDGRQLRFIHKKFGSVKLKTFPNYTLLKLIYNGFILGIKSIYPFYFIDYQKQNAQKFLQENFNWQYYGGHHHENIFTKFSLSYWLPKKFAIDKRKITLSAQVLSGELSRQEALAILQTPPCDPEEMERDKDYVLKKLSISENEFREMLRSENKFFTDYPSYYPFMERFTILAGRIIGLFLPYKPMAFFQIEMRKKRSAGKP
jgi:N-acetyl sugar amidotransferase